jgi:hypothetical protein
MTLETAARYLLLTFFALIVLPAALAQDEPRIGELSYLDRQFMAQQRALLQDLTARNFGRRFSGQRDNDLELLQLLLDRKLVRPEQTRELQAMGVILGDLLASELDLRWVVYQDNLGRSRALRDDVSGTYLFPITMISRRREVDNRTPVETIYNKASKIITDSRPALPFQ